MTDETAEPLFLFVTVRDGYAPATIDETNRLLQRAHYLGATRRGWAFGQYLDGRLVAVQVWNSPSGRHLPADGTWLELSRWCLTPEAGQNAGSKMHARSVRWIKSNRPGVTTLLSYSDPSQGHTGALYRACNWRWAPTWHRLRPPPTGNGSWDGRTTQSVKDRWVFPVRRDPQRRTLLSVKDGAVAHLAPDLEGL